MKAVVFVPAAGGASVEVRTLPQPVAGPGEALVRVRAAGLNRGEFMVRQGLERGEPQQTGIEFAGEIAALGDGVSRLRVGDRVMGHWKAGQAEYVAVDARLLVPVPDRLSWVEAGAWLNNFVTAHDALLTNAALARGDAVLVTAASSGIGVAALQIARLIGATPVIGSSRSPAKFERLRPLGLTVAVAGDASLPAAVRAATDGRGVDVVLDNVGAAMLMPHLRAMALGGRFVSVGRLGETTGPIDLDYVALRRLQLIGVTFRTRSLAERIACVQRCADDLLPALADGRLAPVVDRTFPIDAIAEAHDAMARDAHVGKIVIEIP